MAITDLPANLKRVLEEIDRVQCREGVSGNVRIVAVTKGHPAAAVTAAHSAGVADVGENRVQEALGKQDVTRNLQLRWHLVGHLQTNKAKYVPGRFSVVHSVDSVRVADALALAVERAERSEVRIEAMVQVNVACEPQKSGCQPAEASGIAARIAEQPALQLAGLMTIAPFTDDEKIQRSVFAALRQLREDMQHDGLAAPELSMGMSADYRAAVAEGATILRLGTALFGERPT
jgi:pyridoxal phosphate enzyme (YggS family)